MKNLIGFLFFGLYCFTSFAIPKDVSIVPATKSSDYFECRISYNKCSNIPFPTASGDGANCIVNGRVSQTLRTKSVPDSEFWGFEYKNNCNSDVEVTVKFKSGTFTGKKLKILKGAEVFMVAGASISANEGITDINFKLLSPAPVPEPPDLSKPLPISSTYPGQCNPGVVSDRVSGFSVINLGTRSFTEEIAIPGSVFKLVYDSKLYVKGNSNFSPERLVGGWAMSQDSFYDYGKNIVYYGSGEMYVPERRFELEGDYYIVLDMSGDSFSYYSRDRKYIGRQPVAGRENLVYTRVYNGTDLAGFVNFNGNSTIIHSDRGFILDSLNRMLAKLDYYENGLLKSVELFRGGVYELTYDENKRLRSFKKPLGKVSYFEYDSDGYLIKDSSSLGRFINVNSEYNSSLSKLTVSAITSGGLKRDLIIENKSGVVSRLTSNDFGGNSQVITNSKTGKNQVIDIYDGVNEFETQAHPRWSGYLKYNSSDEFNFETIKIKKREKKTTSNNIDSSTITYQGDSKRTYRETLEYKDKSSRVTVVSPEKRKSIYSFDGFGQLLESVIQDKNGKALLTEKIIYDENNRISSYVNNSGNSLISIEYSSEGFLRKITDIFNVATEFYYDSTRRLYRIVYPNGKTVDFTYDLEGHLTGVKPPSRPFHNFNFNMNGLNSEYLPPLAKLSGTHTEFKYDQEERISEIYVGGLLAGAYKYGANESRLFEVRNSHSIVNLNYALSSKGNPTDLVSELSTSDGVKTNISYLWMLPTTIETLGPIQTKLQYKYNSDATLAEIETSGADGKILGFKFSYDLDGLPVKMGSLSLSYDMAGRLYASSLGVVKNLIKFDKSGYLIADSYSVNKKSLVDISYERDQIGRVSSSTFNSTSSKTTFQYDQMGRLISAAEGDKTREYLYDDNGNRLEFKSGSEVMSGTYDDQDRLLSYGPNKYEYSKFGNLSRKVEYSPLTVNPAITEYEYDSVGSLRSVKLSDGRFVEYIIDGQNRRIGKKINGNLVQGFIYQSQFQIAAETDASGNVVRRFVYGSKINSPDYVISGGVEYRVVSDQVGTPKFVVEAKSGKIVETLNYDEFGVSLDGKHSEFLPFGFASGINDRDTGLIRFGARDYDPQVGRWTNRDPIGFSGGDTNLYAYVLNNPVNLADPSGNCPWCIGAAIGAVTSGVTAYMGNASPKDIIIASAIGAVSGGLSMGMGNYITSASGIAGSNAIIGGIASLTSQLASGVSPSNLSSKSVLVGMTAGALGGLAGLGAGNFAFSKTPVIGREIGVAAARRNEFWSSTLVGTSVGSSIEGVGTCR